MTDDPKDPPKKIIEVIELPPASDDPVREPQAITIKMAKRLKSLTRRIKNLAN